jgi:enoyl-CoA hydratase/carnithine racemase
MTATVAAKPAKQPPLPAPNSDFYEGLETSQDEGLLLEASYFGLCAGTEDKKEGTSAFLERRAPQFRGR